MTSYDFFLLLYEKWWWYIASFLIVIPFYIFILKRTVTSLLDPVTFSQLSAFTGYSALLFLYFTGNTTDRDFVYCVSSISVFWLSFFCFRKQKSKRARFYLKDCEKFERPTFILCFFILVILTLISYVYLGIPIFNEESRLATFAGSGLGFIYRISPVLNVYSLFYIFKNLTNIKKINIINKFFIILCFLVLISFGVLSGSRSSFFQIIFAFWGFGFFYKKDEPKLMKYRKLVLAFIPISVFTFYLQSGSVNSALFGFYERIVANGDLYWYSLPNEIWRDVKVTNPISMTLYPFFGPLRLMTDSQTPIGFQLYELATGLDKLSGPVALYPVYSLICFGYGGGLLFCFLQGIISAKLYSLKRYLSSDLIVCTMMYLFYKTGVTFMGSCVDGLQILLDMILGSFVLLSVSMVGNIISLVSRKNNV